MLLELQRIIELFALVTGQCCVHLSLLRQIVRDIDVAQAISPVVHEHTMTCAQTEQALKQLHVPRAANIAEIGRDNFAT